MRLDPKHLTLGQLLLGRLFRIPNYQRAYSWQSKQRAELFADIDTIYRTKQDHFLATVVAVMQENTAIGADEFQVVDVVDGQQRLTTFVLLLKAVEKAVVGTTSVEQKVKRELLEMLVKGDDHSLVLLQTNHDSSYVFRDYIRTGIVSSGPFATAADKNLVDAAKECEEYVSGWAKRGELVELVSILKHRLSMIVPFPSVCWKRGAPSVAGSRSTLEVMPSRHDAADWMSAMVSNTRSGLCRRCAAIAMR